MEIKIDGVAVADITVGCDPELFLKDPKGNLVSAHGFIKGTKENPFPVQDGAIQVDGMALEFNTNPADCIETFVSNVNSVMGALADNIPKGFELSIIPTAEFGADYIKQQPDIAQELGCSPDFNAYNKGEPNPKPDGEVPFRTASGHIHIGWTLGEDINDKIFKQTCCDLTKILDLYLGVPSVLIDSDKKRRSLYGQAGAYRPKPYGLEYRVLSNFWIQMDEYTRWAYNQTILAVKKYIQGFRVPNDVAEKVAETINSSDVDYAQGLTHLYEIEVPNA